VELARIMGGFGGIRVVGRFDQGRAVVHLTGLEGITVGAGAEAVVRRGP
jgi:hypothetical protein